MIPKAVKFEVLVKHVLTHFSDSTLLGESSPLAAPYFIGASMNRTRNIATAQERGEALQSEVLAAAQSLWQGELPTSKDELHNAILQVRANPRTPPYAYLVLELRYFQQYIQLKKTSDIWEDEDLLLGSRATHFRDVKRAINLLSEALMQRLQPTFRLERPVALARYIGYEAEFTRLLQAIRAKQAISISGTGGVGKSTMGARLFDSMPDTPKFWFTIRPTFNDYLGSLLFALGHFLHSHGAPNLWEYLVTAEGQISDLNIALGLVRLDLDSFGDSPPLLIIDEVDTLHLSETEPPSRAHRQILEFFDSIRHLAPIVFIGQRAVIESDIYEELKGFAITQFAEQIAQTNFVLAQDDIERIYDYTGGNPRLLHLALLILQRDDNPNERDTNKSTTPVLLADMQKQKKQVNNLLDRLPHTPIVEPLLLRLWLRLSTNEQSLLKRLSVFRGIAPADGWLGVETEQQRLTDNGLILNDGCGGISLLPALRDAVYGQLTTAQCEQFHLEAATIRSSRFEFTSATYHYWKAGEPTQAIELWATNQEREIQRGQGEAARNIFDEISRKQIEASIQQKLSLILARLYQLRGEAEAGLAALNQLDWSDTSLETIQANVLSGDFSDTLGEPDVALRHYTTGAKQTTQLLEQLIDVHCRSSLTNLRQRDFSAAWSNERNATYALLSLRGELHEEEGNYQKALASFEEARTIAEAQQDQHKIAHAERNLANIYGRLQQDEKAIDHAHRAIAIFESIGDRLNMEKMYGNIAFICVQTQRFEQAIVAATRAYKYFTAIKDSYNAAGCAGNLAEAYFELGKLEQAQYYAHAVLALEEGGIIPYAIFTLGQIKQAEESWEQAEQYFLESAKIADHNNDPFLKAYAQRSLALVYGKRQRTDEAQAVAEDALHLFKQLEMELEIQETAKVIEEISLTSVG